MERGDAFGKLCQRGQCATLCELFLNSAVNSGTHHSLALVKMASVGALLDHLVRERAASDYDDDGVPGLNVKDIHILAL